MRLIDRREIRIGWAASVGVGVLFIYLAALAPIYTPQVFALFGGLLGPLLISLGALSMDKVLIIALIVIMSPPAVLHQMRRRWKLAVDRNLPELLRDVANAQATGMTFIRALENSAQKDYGPLTLFLRRALAQISWGVSYEEALWDMAEHIDTVLVRKTVLLIVETGRMGGNIMAIMDSIAKHIRSLEDLERERLTGIRPNVFIIYLGFFVLVVAAVLVYTSFISTLFTGEFAGRLGAIMLRRGVFTQLDYLRIFLHTTAIAAFFGGLMAGQMGEGAVESGLKHAVVMLAMTLVVFIFILV